MHEVNLPVSEFGKSLSIILDSSLSFNQNVNNSCKSAHFRIRATRNYFSVGGAKSFAMALMMSARLDYCNSVLNGTSQVNVSKLQRVQSMLYRTVDQARKYDNVTPILAGLQ